MRLFSTIFSVSENFVFSLLDARFRADILRESLRETVARLMALGGSFFDNLVVISRF